MRKMLSLLLIVGIVAVLFAGCGKTEVNLETVSQGQSVSEQNNQVVSEPKKAGNSTENQQANEDTTTEPEETTNEDSQGSSPSETTEPTEPSQPVTENIDKEWFTEVVSARVVSQSEGALEWKNANGKTVNFSNGGGKLYLIDVWAQWCPPCKASTSTMIAMYNKYKDNGLVVLGINVDEPGNLTLAKEFASSEGIRYPVLHDPQSSKIAGIYVGQGIPQFTLLDSTGKVYFTNTGAIIEGSSEATQLESAIRRALGL
ncbi:MAG: TlpA family protein disulfide reductase [Caldisericia bacterium]|nr:TlpA family protein disulfide reductase [Caldisericia bacterium]